MAIKKRTKQHTFFVNVILAPKKGFNCIRLQARNLFVFLVSLLKVCQSVMDIAHFIFFIK